MPRFVSTLLALSLALPLFADGLEDLKNPLGDSVVGEWTKYTIQSENQMMGKVEIPVAMIVMAVEGANIDVKTEMEMMGMAQEDTQTFDAEGSIADMLLSQFNQMGGGAEVTIEESSVEDVEYEHEGVTYAAKKITIVAKATVEGMGMKIDINNTTWLCLDIPVTGILKSVADTTIHMGEQTMEASTVQTLVGFGLEPAQEEDKGNEDETGEF